MRKTKWRGGGLRESARRATRVVDGAYLTKTLARGPTDCPSAHVLRFPRILAHSGAFRGGLPLVLGSFSSSDTYTLPSDSWIS